MQPHLVSHTCFNLWKHSALRVIKFKVRFNYFLFSVFFFPSIFQSKHFKIKRRNALWLKACCCWLKMSSWCWNQTALAPTAAAVLFWLLEKVLPSGPPVAMMYLSLPLYSWLILSISMDRGREDFKSPVPACMANTWINSPSRFHLSPFSTFPISLLLSTSVLRPSSLLSLHQPGCSHHSLSTPIPSSLCPSV